MELAKEDLERLYELLLLTRTLDDRLRKLFRQGRFEGTYFSAIGQEATTVVPTFLLKKDDFIGPAHREIGAMITRGVPLREIVCQVYARQCSPDGGKMHPCVFGHPGHHILIPATLMGMQIPVVVGVAMGYKIRRRDNIAVAFFGEGATCKGDFHEGLNFAGVHKVPAVFICQNNFYAESVPLHLQTAIPEIALRAGAYGIPGVSIDGNDVLKVYETCQEAFQRARSGGGPTLIECKTYRWYGHSDIDLASYR
ncbi:MAG: thiamine pyrophosphate-dependent dehydrogenase E1 component subunit alpha, partial [Candidatus Tectomicrobia bacterium]|nr:thiamine pyrophosphate-dependent dehydrogenase E1 component subunit alpha [Candidatus Tectomicrobia bacterium]